MKLVSEHISYREAIRSEVAKRNGLLNYFTPEQLERMKLVAEKIFEPVRNYFNVPIFISSFFRTKQLNILLNGAINSQHCFTIDTEILTDSGWKLFKDFNIENDLLATLNIEINKIEFIKGDSLINYFYKGDVVHILNDHIDSVVTDKHRMFVLPKSINGKYKFELAKSLINRRRKHRVSGELLYDNIEIGKLPKVEIARFCAAIIAEGCVFKKLGCKKYSIRFNVKKDREIKELENLLSLNNILYKKRYCKNREKQNQFGVYEYNINCKNSERFINIITKNKIFPNYFLYYNKYELRDIITTYAKFDGTFSKIGSSFRIFSTNKFNIDLLQAMCVLCNYRSFIETFNNLKTSYNVIKNFYRLNITDAVSTTVETNGHIKDYYEGEVFCINNKNETIITRRKGKVLISGNCANNGAAIDVDADVYCGVTNKQIFDYIRLNLDFDQLILENVSVDGTGGWVHFSYVSPEKNRQEVVTMEIVNGKQIYKPYK